MRFLSLFFFVFVFLNFIESSAKVFSRDHARVRVISEAKEIRGSSVQLGVHYDLDPEWHIYWKNPGDSGAAPKFDLSSGQLKSVEWPFPERLPVKHLTNYGYSQEAVIFLNIENFSIGSTLSLEWLVCKVECVPGFAEVVLDAENIENDPLLYKSFRSKLPQKMNSAASFQSQDQQTFRFIFELSEELNLENLKNAFVFPENGLRYLTKSPEVKVENHALGVSVQISESSNTVKTSKILENFTLVFEFLSGEKKAFDVQVEPKSQNLVWGLFLAFMGGLILNLMPCVFPVLFLKGFSFLKAGATDDKDSSEKVKIRKSAWLYSLGVVLSFVVVGGVLMALRLSGIAVGWGFQLQSPIIVSLLIALFVFMGVSFLGWFKFDGAIAARLQNWSTQNISGDFSTGVLAVVVASPCTAPFMGTALGMTLFLSPWESLLVFASLGVGMALPFPLMAHWPWLISKLPRAGGWMLKAQKLMAIPLFLTAGWLAWVLSVQLLSSQPGQYDFQWEKFDGAQIEELRKERPVFVDFTAAWCITCQVNKKTVLRTDEIMRQFKENDVFLMQADWTNHDEKITQALAKFGRNSVPLYVYYSRIDGPVKVLPELLTKADIEKLFAK